MSTFLQLQTDSIDLLHELVNQPTYTVAKLKGYINRGNILFARKTKCIEGTTTITTVANQVEYDQSDAAGLANLSIPYQVRYIDGTEAGRPLKPYPGGYTNLPKEYSYGDPIYYWVRNVHAATTTAPAAYQGIRIGTIPIAGTSAKTISVDGFMRPTVLSADADTPEIQPEWHDALVYYAVSRMFGMFGHLRRAWENKSLLYLKMFDDLVNESNVFMINQSDEPIESVDVYHQMDGGDYY